MENIEYEWLKQTRNLLLEQCSNLEEEELSKEFDFGLKSIKNTLVHIAGCYHAWLGAFVLGKTDTPLFDQVEIDHMGINEIKQYFWQADLYVEAVLNQSKDKLNTIIENKLVWKANNEVIRKSAHQLLFHSITHEFHHKGQIGTMFRKLGHSSNHTDILALDI